jgi:putative MFS transporter
VGVATFFDAFDFLTIAFVLPVLIPAWHIKPSNVGFLISAGALGQLIGAIFFGRLAERIGRLRTTILTILVYGVFSFFCAVSWSYTSLLIFRIIQGFGLGGEVPIAASYINEIAKAKNRGRFFLLYEMVFPAGLLIAAFAGYWIVPHLGWRWLFVVGSPVAALAIYMRWRLPESPRWLASVGRYEEAEKAMVFIERNVKQAYGADLPEPEKIKPVGAVAGKRTRFVELFSPVYLRRTLIVWSIWFSAYLAGYGITTWLPSLYRTVFKLPLDKALLYGTITQIGALIASFAAAMLVDKVGRRTLIGTVMVIGGLFQLLLWYTGASTAFRVLVLATFGHSFISAAAFTIYLYTPELYPTRMRALGTSIASSWLRIAVMLGPVITGFVVARYTVSWAFLVFAGVVILAGVVTLLFGVETKGKVLEEVSP